LLSHTFKNSAGDSASSSNTLHVEKEFLKFLRRIITSSDNNNLSLLPAIVPLGSGVDHGPKVSFLLRIHPSRRVDRRKRSVYQTEITVAQQPFEGMRQRKHGQGLSGAPPGVANPGTTIMPAKRIAKSCNVPLGAVLGKNQNTIAFG
jgi:hypothetical protein